LVWRKTRTDLRFLSVIAELVTACERCGGGEHDIATTIREMRRRVATTAAAKC
jgi:hypothetical protein